MRYVIVVVAVAIFIVWDGLKNNGQYIDMGVREINRLMAMLR
jgi:hypothetical protein